MSKFIDENIEKYINELWSENAPKLTEREKTSLRNHFWLHAKSKNIRRHKLVRSFAVAMTLCLFFVFAYRTTNGRAPEQAQLVATESNSATYDQIVQTLSADDVVKTLTSAEQEQLIAILSDM